tara:strand:+ start:4624 stop:4851 length:228 start_codon:yes stop_codon:yes gene_type:complete
MNNRKNRNLRVDRKYRINRLCDEGTNVVLVVYQDGCRLEYDGIVYPSSYINSLNNDIVHGDIEKVYLNGELYRQN